MAIGIQLGTAHSSRGCQVLFGAEISFSGLHRSVAKQHLDLLKFTARGPAPFRTGPTQIVGSESGQANLCRVPAEHLPDNFLA